MMSSNYSLVALPDQPMTRDYVGDDIPQPARVFFIILGIFLMISGTLGNLLVLVTLYKCPSLHSLHYVYVANLAIADFVIEAYSSPFVMYDLILGYHPVINHTHCIFNGFLVVMCYVSSLFTLASISFNRYMHVCQNAIYNRYVTRRLTLSMLVLVWVISAAVAAAPLFGWGHYGYDVKTHYCGYNRTASISYTILIAVGTIALPATAVCFFNYSIFSYVREARKTLSKWRNDAGLVDSPGYGAVTAAHTKVDEFNLNVRADSTDHMDNVQETKFLTPRKLNLYTGNQPRFYSPSEVTPNYCQKKENNPGSEKVTKKLYGDGLIFLNEQQQTTLGQGQIEEHSFLYSQLSVSTPNLQYQGRLENKNSLREGSTRVLTSPEQESLFVETAPHKLETRHQRNTASVKKTQSLPDTRNLSILPTCFIPHKKSQHSPGSIQAGKSNKIRKLKSNRLKIPSNELEMKDSQAVVITDSTTHSSSPTIQIMFREISSEVTSGTVETSTTTGSERSGRRRQKKMRSASRGPGSVKIKRQQDFRSRKRSSSQKTSRSFTVCFNLGTVAARQNVVSFTRWTRCCGVNSSTPRVAVTTGPGHTKSQIAETLSDRGAIVYRGQQRSQPLGINNLDMIRTLFVVFVCMAVFMSPYMVTTIADVHDRWPAVVHCACSYLAVVNNAINWMLYGMLNSSFRAGYRHVMFSPCSTRTTSLQTKV